MLSRLRAGAMSSGLIAAKDIPSISQLYRNKTLRPSSDEDLPNPSQQHNDRICVIQEDITKLEVDAIVNAANRRLLGGGGVDGAIHRAAGPQLVKECATLGGCETGSAKITDAYRLPCKKVIHAVGPVFNNLEVSEPLLRSCYRTALQLAVGNDCKTIAFPNISCGVYGYPSRPAARAAIRETLAFLKRPEGQKLEKIVFCNFLDRDMDSYADCLPTVFPPTEDDLSHTGEYDGKENLPPKDIVPTTQQILPKETCEHPERISLIEDTGRNKSSAIESPLTQKDIETIEKTTPAADNDVYLVKHARSDTDSTESDSDSSTGSKRSRNGGAQLESPSKKRRLTKGELTSGARSEDDGTVEYIDSDPEDVAKTLNKTTISTTSSVPLEDNSCYHNRFEKHDGTSSHGLWPHCAMICECGKNYIQARGTELPSIGRGDFRGFY
ncbi:hypothetical protein LTR99_006470 [Exophiala xenobiotica]|uniref:Macro domain-containing protein n=1 Tax=Vermiconidia calcicola TaxID=1690605 RepID=A0AAV9QAK9_9PEZI|nr:hypothetical protein LTR96_007316 [Exophiala xenobiotica]KAK5536959.1 hypothetical protein LTR23_007807 [Chaetothyriales sp. CCFEE 6169]KAK5537640.1 hypothetical protein LTR25_004892 [Vermiconidia calcicola]KAK5301503.1 hypothetical protein LTR99_006470 [Exophiala xenobiotica]KAK5335022.1 hypothetical protein LTR98_008742 [Exophiala xenobiotica]